GPDSPYLELSETARKAEAEAEALRNGTLAGATLAEAEAEDLLTAPYVDGQPAPGVRDLKVRLEQVKTQLAGYETARTTLLERKAHYEALAEQFGEAARKTGAGAEDLSTRIAKLMEQCTAQLPRAEKAADAALKSFSKAGQFAQAAIRAAAQRTREARSAAATAVGIEAERLRMITDDGDTEASVQELAAEAAYQAALTRAIQMHALQRRYGTERFVASLADRSEPESIEDRVEAYRKEAIERLASARKALEAAERLIAKSRARTDHGTVQGKDYVWQVKVGQAAVHLLEAALLDDTDAVFAKKDAAYRLLTEAAQGRERSPLLTPAIETLQYLQDSVR
ncbi:MAG: hypothetical protein ACE5E1_04395, partial [Phycisphaerae bacterium]